MTARTAAAGRLAAEFADLVGPAVIAGCLARWPELSVPEIRDQMLRCRAAKPKDAESWLFGACRRAVWKKTKTAGSAVAEKPAPTPADVPLDGGAEKMLADGY